MLITILLADVADPGGYMNFIKVGIVLGLFVAWVFACQWVDRDTDLVKTRREYWNLVTLGGGVLGLLVLFMIPWAGVTVILGLAFWILLAGGAQLTYVFHRNGRVVRSRRVLTPNHLRRLITRGEEARATKVDRGQRVHLAGRDGKEVTRPSELEEFERYNATQEFIFDVLWRRATDVDVVLSKDKVRVVYKIDGVASERKDILTPDAIERVLAYVKQLAGLNPEEIRRPQEGMIQAALLGHAGDLGKVSVVTSGSTMGERLRLRILAPASKRRLKEIGLAPSRLELVKKLIKAPTGLVLVSGPKQSGVTTTQYAIVRSHDAFMQNIHTLERHTIYELDNMTQTPYDTSSEGVSYSRQLQSVLRREPEVILVGECEEPETALISLRAAVRDRKIYLAMEAKSTFDALSRLMGMAEDNELVSKALLGVINQRLVRILCTSCRQSYKPDEALLRKANLPVDKIEHFHRPPTEPVFDRKGREIICQTCQGSGYVGRVGVFEVLVVDDAIRKLIAAGAPVRQIKSQARKNRMLYLQEEGLHKVIDGTTSLDEIIRGLREDAK